MVVDGLEILRFHDIGIDALVLIQGCGHVANQVFHELGVLVGPLGDELLVRALQQAVQLTGGVFLGDVDDVLDPDEGIGPDRDGDVGTLVVGAVLGNLLGAGAQAGAGHQDFHGLQVFAVLDFADEGDVVVHQALHAGHGGLLVDEVGEVHLDVAGLGFQLLHHQAQHLLEGLHRELPLVAVEDFDETRHVGALEVMGQIHVHAKRGDGVLGAAGLVQHPNRMPDGLDAHLVDGDLARVRIVLHIGDGGDGAGDVGLADRFTGAHGGS